MQEKVIHTPTYRTVDGSPQAFFNQDFKLDAAQNTWADASNDPTKLMDDDEVIFLFMVFAAALLHALT